MKRLCRCLVPPRGAGIRICRLETRVEPRFDGPPPGVGTSADAGWSKAGAPRLRRGWETEVSLQAEASATRATGQSPSVAVAGRDNSPVYLLPLSANQACVTATTGGTVTMPEAPGFALEIAPGSVTFPGGSQTGCVSVTSVHPDKVPMVPGFGQQPRFVVTVQPAGAVFNPPAKMTMPNVDGLKPREVTEMYSFDHDLNAFVAIGTATVTDDGLLVRSDPGVGVVKAGWSCAGIPVRTGSAECLQAYLTTDLAPNEEGTIGTNIALQAFGSPPTNTLYDQWSVSSVGQLLSQSSCPNSPSCTATVSLNSPGLLLASVRFQNTAILSQVQATTSLTVRPRPKLTIDKPQLKRGQIATFRVEAARGSQVSNWRFIAAASTESPGFEVSRGNSNDWEWKGVMVSSGIAEATVQVPKGQPETISAEITVVDRPELKMAMRSPQKVAPGFIAPISGVSLSMPATPTQLSAIGLYYWDATYSLKPDLILSGPNKDVIYVTAFADATHFNTSQQPLVKTTGAYYTVHGYVDGPTVIDSSPAGLFKTGNCGSFHPLNNPNGFIHREKLFDLVSQHEALSGIRSHHAAVAHELDKEEKNLGIVADRYFRKSSTSLALQDFATQIRLRLDELRDGIQEAQLWHADGPTGPPFPLLFTPFPNASRPNVPINNASYDAGGVFWGVINFMVVPCP